MLNPRAMKEDYQFSSNILEAFHWNRPNEVAKEGGTPTCLRNSASCPSSCGKVSLSRLSVQVDAVMREGGRMRQNFVPITSVTETRSLCLHCRLSCIPLCVMATTVWHSDVQKHTSWKPWVHIQNVPWRRVHTSPIFRKVLYKKDMEDNYHIYIFEELCYMAFKAV
jgi:hypothetical protein